MTDKTKLAIATIVSALLTACGGGGAGSATAQASVTPTAQTPTNTPVKAFSALAPAPNFNWSTQKTTEANSNSILQIIKSSGGVIGDVRVTISNFIETDPTGGGGAIAPMSTDVISSAIGGNSTGSTVSVNFGKLAIPSGADHVYVEVFSQSTSIKLGGVKLTTGQVLSGTQINL